MAPHARCKPRELGCMAPISAHGGRAENYISLKPGHSHKASIVLSMSPRFEASQLS
jgi:hypothetical protein